MKKNVTMSASEKESPWPVILGIAMLVSVIFFFSQWGKREEAYAVHLTHLTLTIPGCAYLKQQAGIEGHIGNDGLCEVDVNYIQNKLSLGGKVIFGDKDSQKLEISAAQIVGAYQIAEAEKPPTDEQKSASIWMYSSIGLLALISLGFLAENRMRDKRKLNGNNL